MLVPARPVSQAVRELLHALSTGGPWRGSRKARRFELAPACQPRYVPAHPFAASVGRFRESTGNRAMSKPAEASFMNPRLSVKPAEYKRLAGEMLEVTRTYLERLSSLAMLARTLRKGIAMNHCDRRDQMLLAELLERTAHQYETEANIERGRISVVMADAEEVEANAARRRKGMGESVAPSTRTAGRSTLA